jgi:hypothetical protein
MSIANLIQQPRGVLYANGLDSLGPLELGTVTATQIDIGHDNIPIFINGVPFVPGGLPVVPNTLAFFAGPTTASIDDTSITVFGVNNSLHFDPAGIIENNNYFSSNGTINIGGPTDTDIFMDASNSIVIGHEGLAVQIVDGVITNFVRTSDVDRNGTPDPINIGGTFASAVNLGRVGQNVNVLGNLIADGIDSSNPVGLFPNSPFITAGAVGGDVSFNGGISFNASGADAIDYFKVLRIFAVDGSGPFVTQNVGTYSVQRLGTMVTFNFRWTVGIIPATANGNLTLSPVLPAEFRPTMGTFSFICSVKNDGVNYIPGQVEIDTTGLITIHPLNPFEFSIADMIILGAICFSYDILI